MQGKVANDLIRAYLSYLGLDVIDDWQYGKGLPPRAPPTCLSTALSTSRTQSLAVCAYLHFLCIRKKGGVWCLPVSEDVC